MNVSTKEPLVHPGEQTALDAYPAAPAFLELYLHPRRFIERLPTISMRPWLVAAIIYMIGLAHRLNYSENPLLPIAAKAPTWSQYWSVACLAALFSAPFILVGWVVFFRVRLWLAGGKVVGRGTGVRVVIASLFAFAVPTLVEAVAATFAFASPLAGAGHLRFWGLTLFAAIASAALEYTGARVTYGAPRARALLCFVVVPVLLLAVVFGAVLWARLSPLSRAFG